MLPPTSYDKPSFPTKSGISWTPPEKFWAYLCNAFGEPFVIEESAKANAWLAANPRRLKTAMQRFLNGWMARAAREEKLRPQQVSVDKDWSDVPPEDMERMRAKYNARGKA